MCVEDLITFQSGLIPAPTISSQDDQECKGLQSNSIWRAMEDSEITPWSACLEQTKLLKD